MLGQRTRLRGSSRVRTTCQELRAAVLGLGLLMMCDLCAWDLPLESGAFTQEGEVDVIASEFCVFSESNPAVSFRIVTY